MKPESEKNLTGWPDASFGKVSSVHRYQASGWHNVLNLLIHRAMWSSTTRTRLVTANTHVEYSTLHNTLRATQEALSVGDGGGGGGS